MKKLLLLILFICICSTASAGDILISGNWTKSGAIYSTANADVVVQGDLTVSGNTYLNKEYLLCNLAADQTSGITAGNDVDFVKTKGNITYNDTTHTATLTGGKTYKITSQLSANGSATTCILAWTIRNGTTSSNITNTQGTIYAASKAGTNNSDTGTNFTVITPATDTDVYIYLSYVASLTSIESTGSYFYIEEIL